MSFKRKYLFWFLDTQRLKWPKTAKVLEYIAENEHILDRVELVDNIKFHQNALMISARGTATYPFLLRLNGQYIYDVDQAIEALATVNFYKLYVKISYSRDFVERKPSVSKARVWKIKRVDIGKLAGKRRRAFYQHLMALVDITLDQRDKEGFYRLTNQLRKLISG